MDNNIKTTNYEKQKSALTCQMETKFRVVGLIYFSKCI